MCNGASQIRESFLNMAAISNQGMADMNLSFGCVIQAIGEVGFNLPQNSKEGGDTLSCTTWSS